MSGDLHRPVESAGGAGEASGIFSGTGVIDNGSKI